MMYRGLIGFFLLYGLVVWVGMCWAWREEIRRR